MSKKPKFMVGQMFSPSFENLPDSEIVQNLEACAYSILEDHGYTKVLTEEELAEKKSELAEKSIAIDSLETQKKEYVSEIKKQMDPLVADKNELLQTIKRKSEFIKGTVFEIDDQEAGKMYMFDSQGMCIGERPLLRRERQLSLVSQKEGTNE